LGPDSDASGAVGGHIFELRLHFGPGYRVYFTYRDSATVILLVGGDKHSQRRDVQFVDAALETGEPAVLVRAVGIRLHASAA
jgi:putative addiction module killer protein